MLPPSKSVLPGLSTPSGSPTHAWFERYETALHMRLRPSDRWMWDLVNEYIDRLLHEKTEVRAVATQVEAAVRCGSMTASDGAENVLRAIGFPDV